LCRGFPQCTDVRRVRGSSSHSSPGMPRRGMERAAALSLFCSLSFSLSRCLALSLSPPPLPPLPLAALNRRRMSARLSTQCSLSLSEYKSASKHGAPPLHPRRFPPHTQTQPWCWCILGGRVDSTTALSLSRTHTHTHTHKHTRTLSLFLSPSLPPGTEITGENNPPPAGLEAGGIWIEIKKGGERERESPGPSPPLPSLRGTPC
jgi:hypothetical protein